MESLSQLDTSSLDEVPDSYGLTEVMDLAEHFSIDNDDLINEWTSFCQLISDKDSTDRTITACLKLLLNDKLGLNSLYPNLTRLSSTAEGLPLSTAEVERVFSQVKLIKNEHRKRMKEVTLFNILNM